MTIRYLTAMAVAATLTSIASADEWLQFRGPGCQSVADEVSVPLEWSVETGQNIAWQADLPGDGVSSPIVVDGRVIVTAADGADHDELMVLAFDSATGKELWRRKFWATGRTLCYRTSSVAAPTPVSDGENVYAFYSSNDLVCLDLDGNLKWLRGLTLDHQGLGNDIGMAASPVVVGDAVIVQCDCQSVAFAAAFNKNTGATLWETPRTENSNWASPLGLPALDAVLLQGRDGLSLLGAKTGEKMWDAKTDAESIPSAATSGDLVVIPSDGLSLFKKTADGLDVVWRKGGVRPGSPSPVVYGDRIYTIARGGVMSAVDLETGESAFKRRLGGSFWATPLATAGRLYCINQDGDAFVVDAGGKGKVLSKSSFGDAIYGSPAAADGGMFVRSNGKLWKIAAMAQAARPADNRVQ
ncbi:MAG: PQQ-binding-like beta-propeller repeat protein [Planctomycetota bacterium]